MNLKEQEEAYPPTQISEALYEGGHLEYYRKFVARCDIFTTTTLPWTEDNATGAQEETIRLNQDDSPRELNIIDW